MEHVRDKVRGPVAATTDYAGLEQQMVVVHAAELARARARAAFKAWFKAQMAKAAQHAADIQWANSVEVQRKLAAQYRRNGGVK